MMTHLLKKLGKREKRQFQEGKHKQQCFNMMVASGTQWKVKGAKEKLLTIETLWMVAWGTTAWNINLVWMQRILFCVVLWSSNRYNDGKKKVFKIRIQSHPNPAICIIYLSKASHFKTPQIYFHCFKDRNSSTQLSVLTLDFDRWQFSNVVEHPPPLPHNALRGHEWKAPMYIKTANTLPAPSSNMIHVRQRWPQQWLDLFDGKMLECLFTSGSPLLACQSVAWLGSLKSSWVQRGSRALPGVCAQRRPYWQPVLFKTHGQNRKKECVITTGKWRRGDAQTAAWCFVIFDTNVGAEIFWTQSVFN